jgi:hypothetical protein
MVVKKYIDAVCSQVAYRCNTTPNQIKNVVAGILIVVIIGSWGYLFAMENITTSNLEAAHEAENMDREMQQYYLENPEEF